jgi:hypothetical protein
MTSTLFLMNGSPLAPQRHRGIDLGRAAGGTLHAANVTEIKKKFNLD